MESFLQILLLRGWLQPWRVEIYIPCKRCLFALYVPTMVTLNLLGVQREDVIFLFKIETFFKLRLERKNKVQTQILHLSWKDYIITFLLLDRVLLRSDIYLVGSSKN